MLQQKHKYERILFLEYELKMELYGPCKWDRCLSSCSRTLSNH